MNQSLDRPAAVTNRAMARAASLGGIVTQRLEDANLLVAAGELKEGDHVAAGQLKP